MLPELSPDDRQAQLVALQEFGFRGGLGIWTDDETTSARVKWKQSSGLLLVELEGPLGIGNLKLEHDGELAVLSRSGTRLVQGVSVDKVLQNGLGLAAPVPMRQLQQWVKGLQGEASSVKRDASDKLASLSYTDELGTRWQARFLRYTVLDGLALPSLITATGGPYNVRLVLKDWQTIVPVDEPQDTQTNRRLAIPSR